ncbi:hypothetical protein Ccrd_008384, partial [Cynara cardunculus var. scolymus]
MENQCYDVVTDAANLSKNRDVTSEHVDDEEDEEGDVDFNPFLKAAPSLEASSSLSSEIEEFDADIVDSGESHPPVDNTANAPEEVQDDNVGNIENGWEITIQEACRDSDNTNLCNKETESNTVTNTVTNVSVEECHEASHSQKPVDDIDDEDAIWRRTRARYSLVSSTLDELETFLQETDDEDDLPNIDDEEEYRKFLAAVLQGGDGSSGAAQENDNVDEEDEDNDADFELEIEEALGSDDEILQTVSQEQEHARVGRRPETRQKKRQKIDLQPKKFSAQTNRPLRPILPYAPITFSSDPNARGYMIQSTSGYVSSSATNDYITAFTPQQIGQLHCLIYEHVQLLVQVFSLSVLEPSRQHIATQVQRLLSEMLHKHDHVLASQRPPYPSFCFNLPYIRSAVTSELQKSSQPQNTSKSSTIDAERVFSSVPHCDPSSYQSVCNGSTGHGQPTEGFFWVPFVSDTVLSVIDVAPLNLVRSYMDDISIAVQEHQQRQLEVSYDATADKECLFPFKNFHSSAEPTGVSSDPTLVPSKASDQKSKKTIAAALVERSKKQSIALVISSGVNEIFVRQKNRSCSRAPENPIKAVRRMKTSPLTPQEKARIEEGLKIYKLDWMAVWKYMVPHRDPLLLARQWRTAVGNQKSYKGDELTKAKRRLYESKRRKSKLEGSRLQTTGAGQNREGWSTEDDVRCKTLSDKENFSTDNAGGDNNSGDDGGNNEDEAYVHEAFLADWRPGLSSEFPVSNLRENDPRPGNFHTQHPNFSSHPVPAKTFRSSEPEVHIRPYRAPRSDCSRLVKLAPDLPPVNLPPTVRIMSQSAFTKYRDEACSKVRENVVSAIPLSHPRISQLDERNPVRCSTSGPVEKGDSDLQMHPLLFQDPEDGSLPYYPLNGSAGSSSSFDFFPNNPPQLNLNLFRYSHQAKNTLNFFNNPLKSKELSSSVSGVDFHPLLQRTDDGNGHSGGAPLVPQLPAASLIAHQKSGSTAINAIPPSPNELDLDIGLSSTARKDKRRSGRESGTTDPQPSGLQNHEVGLLDEIVNDPDSGSRSVGIRNDEIVMEQEELSDSEDEEIAETVEFECEEMTDTEGEGGSDSDHIEDVQNEDLQDLDDSDQDEPRCQETSKPDRKEAQSSLGLSLNPKLPVTRSSHTNRSSKKPGNRTRHQDP